MLIFLFFMFEKTTKRVRFVRIDIKLFLKQQSSSMNLAELVCPSVSLSILHVVTNPSLSTSV